MESLSPQELVQVKERGEATLLLDRFETVLLQLGAKGWVGTDRMN